MSFAECLERQERETVFARTEGGERGWGLGEPVAARTLPALLAW